jgi:hypothetical protein
MRDNTMTEEGKRFWLKAAFITVIGMAGLHALVGCIEVGGSTAGVESDIDSTTTSTATQPASE